LQSEKERRKTNCRRIKKTTTRILSSTSSTLPPHYHNHRMPIPVGVVRTYKSIFELAMYKPANAVDGVSWWRVHVFSEALQ
jgi:hypothetical protein